MTATATMTAPLTGMLTAAHKGDWSAWMALMDFCEEEQGWDMRTERRYTKHEKTWCVAWLEEKFVKEGVLTWQECPSHQTAVAFQNAVASVDIDKVPIMSWNRSIGRKEQARLCRELFKRLGLKGASVTAPSYANASTVDVKLPSRKDFTVDTQSPDFRPGEDHWKLVNDPARVINRQCSTKIGVILAVAFPNHDDRSDIMSDYFDRCWSCT